MQREVLETDTGPEACQHRAQAVEAKLAGDNRARMHFALADAFFAAVAVRDYAETDENSAVLPRATLDAEQVMATQPHARQRNAVFRARFLCWAVTRWWTEQPTREAVPNRQVRQGGAIWTS